VLLTLVAVRGKNKRSSAVSYYGTPPTPMEFWSILHLVALLYLRQVVESVFLKPLAAAVAAAVLLAQ